MNERLRTSSSTVLPMPSKMAWNCFMSPGRGPKVGFFRRKIEPEEPPPSPGAALPRDQPVAEGDAFFAGALVDAEQRAQMKLALLRCPPPGEQAPEKFIPLRIGRGLVETVEREQRRPGDAHPLVVGKEHLQRTGDLDLLP